MARYARNRVSCRGLTFVVLLLSVSPLQGALVFNWEPTPVADDLLATLLPIQYELSPQIGLSDMPSIAGNVFRDLLFCLDDDLFDSLESSSDSMELGFQPWPSIGNELGMKAEPITDFPTLVPSSGRLESVSALTTVRQANNRRGITRCVIIWTICLLVFLGTAPWRRTTQPTATPEHGPDGFVPITLFDHAMGMQSMVPVWPSDDLQIGLDRTGQKDAET